MANLFDMSNPDFIEVGNPSSVDITGNKLTIATQIKVDTLNGEQKFFAKWKNAGSQFQYLLSINSSNKFIGAIYAGGIAIAEGVTTTPTGIWLHVAVVYDGVDIRLYIKGILDGIQAQSGNMPSTPAPLRFGTGSGGEDPFGGCMGHPALWDAALNPSEIQSLANGVSPPKIRVGNLRSYPPLNGQNPELDIITGQQLTVMGTTKVDEPPIPNSIVAP